jgi:hypothetical protein
MALKTIKEIINSKGYVINPKDRAIFETGDLRSFFGLSSTDAIEFIVYDANNNQLPQGSDGSLVRYIPLTSQNISDYILMPEGTTIQKYNLPTEYFIDVERLLGEAGYGNGLFKTQITLINKRVGSQMKDDKLYINEISPSRTEIRLFPLMRSNSDAVKKNLRERFNIFLNDGTFKEDVIARAIQYVEQIKPTEISSFIISKYGEAWFTNFKSEYKVTDFDSLITQAYNIFLQSCIYEFTDRVSDITDAKYGKPKGIQQSLSLTPDGIKKRINILLIQALNKYISIPNVRTTTSEIQTIESKEDVQRVLQTKESDLIIDTTPAVITNIEIKKKKIIGKEISFIEKLKEQVPLQQFINEVPTKGELIKIMTPVSSNEAPNTVLNTFSPETTDRIVQTIPAPPENSTGGGAGGQTITTGEGIVEIRPGEFRNEGAGLARGSRRRDEAQQ